MREVAVLERTEERPLRVLVVDDEADLASNVKDIFEDEGYVVRVGHDGRTAEELCCDEQYDVGLIDIKLPDADGLDLVRRLGRLSPDTEYIMITGYAALGSAMQAVKEERIVAYETKPLDLENVLSLVRQIAVRRQTQRMLAATEGRLQLLLQQLPCVMWTTDEDLRFVSCQGAGTELARLDVEDMRGKTVDSYMEGEPSAPAMVRAHRQALEGQASTFEFGWKGRTLYAHVEPLKEGSSGITGVLGISFDITERKKAENALHALSRRVVNVQEKERRSIASELHDQVGQSLTALRLLLDRASKRATTDEVTTALGEADGIVSDLMTRVRDISLDLRPSVLDDLGLLPALLWHLERYQARTNVQVDFGHSGLQREMAQEASTAAYRIVQEALTNVARHAGVKQAAVRVWTDGDILWVKVDDEGRGFDAAKLAPGSSTGLNGMKERAYLVGGSLTVDTAPGRGTHIIAELPLRE
ncbi:MAG: response regulator [Chloroflexota bacterium]